MTSAEPAWECPACGGLVRPAGPAENAGIRCDACGAGFRHPRMAILLALALPGLGSFHQRRRIEGALLFLLGTGAFAWTLWTMGAHVYRAATGGSAGVGAFLADVARGLAVVVAAYVIDLGSVWLRRRRLVRR